ncbi:MAG: ATP-binding protein [Flavobacteriales bacterium]
MRYVARDLGPVLLKASRSFPAVVLTGPRRAGKTMLLRKLFPKASYTLMEDPDAIARMRADPHGFLDGIRLPAVLDEVQNVPELFSYVRSRIDEYPRRTGQWFLTGSQDAPLMRGVTESMAGRAAMLQLYPLSRHETPKVDMLHGGYPEALARPGTSSLWFSSYIQTYLERDVRAITNVRDLATYRRFMALLATRHGQVLNRTELARPLQVSVPTINQWIGVLEATQQVLVVPPFYENLGKRLIKSPKIYFTDSGLVCHLLGINTAADLQRSPFLGQIFEGQIASEIIKRQVNSGMRRELYFFRDEQGLEVDFIVPARSGGVTLVECMSTRTPLPKMTAPLQQLQEAFKGKKTVERNVEMVLIHRKGPRDTAGTEMHGVKLYDEDAWAARGK